MFVAEGGALAAWGLTGGVRYGASRVLPSGLPPGCPRLVRPQSIRPCAASCAVHVRTSTGAPVGPVARRRGDQGVWADPSCPGRRHAGCPFSRAVAWGRSGASRGLVDPAPLPSWRKGCGGEVEEARAHLALFPRSHTRTKRPQCWPRCLASSTSIFQGSLGRRGLWPGARGMAC